MYRMVTDTAAANDGIQRAAKLRRVIPVSPKVSELVAVEGDGAFGCLGGTCAWRQA
jgi:hypothetical protein